MSGWKDPRNEDWLGWFLWVVGSGTQFYLVWGDFRPEAFVQPAAFFAMDAIMNIILVIRTTIFVPKAIQR